MRRTVGNCRRLSRIWGSFDLKLALFDQDLDIDDVDGCASACKANDRCDCISMHANTWGAGKCRLEASGGGGHTDRNVALYSAMTMDEYDGCQTDGTVPSFEYENTVGYCRGGPAWEAPHAGAGQLWDCSPTGGMNGPNDDGTSDATL